MKSAESTKASYDKDMEKSCENTADLVSSSQTHSPGWHLSIRDYKCPLPKGSGEMPIPFLSANSGE